MNGKLTGKEGKGTYRIPIDIDIRGPAIKAQMREIVDVVFSEISKPQGPKLHASNLGHVSPQGSIPSRTLRIWVWKTRRALRAAAALGAVNAVGAPIVLR